MRSFLAASAAFTLLVNTVSLTLAWPSEVEGQPSVADYAEGQPTGRRRVPLGRQS